MMQDRENNIVRVSDNVRLSEYRVLLLRVTMTKGTENIVRVSDDVRLSEYGVLLLWGTMLG